MHHCFQAKVIQAYPAFLLPEIINQPFSRTPISLVMENIIRLPKIWALDFIGLFHLNTEIKAVQLPDIGNKVYIM